MTSKLLYYSGLVPLMLQRTPVAILSFSFLSCDTVQMLTTLSVITEQKIQVDRAEEFGSVFPNNNKPNNNKRQKKAKQKRTQQNSTSELCGHWFIHINQPRYYFLEHQIKFWKTLIWNWNSATGFFWFFSFVSLQRLSKVTLCHSCLVMSTGKLSAVELLIECQPGWFWRH